MTHSDLGRPLVVCMRERSVHDNQAYDSLRLGQGVVVCMRQSCVNANHACDSLSLGQGRGGVHEAELCKC